MTHRLDWPYPSVAERWLMRYLRLLGFCVAGHETFEAAARAGAAEDDLEAAEAFSLLRRRGWVAHANGAFFLTRDGQAAAEAIAMLSRQLRDPAVPIPERFLPRLAWTDDD
ncbi:MAG: hypothetical protein QY323_05870 [Patescibacteria group bacterium]|nr:MAG: hypothetical protein QY323_05870 [Patescibacteria group bacterium]